MAKLTKQLLNQKFSHRPKDNAFIATMIFEVLQCVRQQKQNLSFLKNEWMETTIELQSENVVNFRLKAQKIKPVSCWQYSKRLRPKNWQTNKHSQRYKLQEVLQNSSKRGT